MASPDPHTLTAPTRRPAGPSLPPPSTRAKRKKKKGNWRKSLFRVHGWIGLNLGLFLFVVCFSGSVATLSHEIDWLLDARHRAPAQDAPYDWTAMHETLAEIFPDGVNLGVYVPGADYVASNTQAAAVAYVELPNGPMRKVYLDPYTGALRGHTSFFNAQRFFRSFHRRFFDGNRGILLVTLWGFVLLAATLSGFAFYKGWLRQLVTLRWKKGPRLRWSDLHKTIGIWGLLFALLIALTGVFYFVEVMYQGADAYDALLPPPLPNVEEASLADVGPQPALLPAGAYVRAAEAAYLALDVRSVRMPNAPGEAVYVDGQAGNPLTRDRADKVHLHPLTGEVLGLQRTSDLGAVPFITDAVDPLHFGYFGGLWMKVLWCVLGLMLSFSILSGTYLWVVRSATSGGGRGSGWLRGAAVSTALTLAYFLMATFATINGIKEYRSAGAEPIAVARLALGPYDVRVDGAALSDSERETTYAVRFLGEGLPNYQVARLIAAGDTTKLSGPSWRPTGVVRYNAATSVQLEVVARDGTTHAAAFTPPRERVAAPSAPAWPDTAPGVWWVVVAFVVLTSGIVAAWLVCLARAFRTARKETPRPAGAPVGNALRS